MFAADARKHTPGKNAEKENFSMRILVCDDDAAFAGQLAEKIEAIVKPQMPRSTVDCATDAAQLRALPLAKYDLAFLDGAHPRSAKHAAVSARRNRAAGQLAHSQRRAENLYAVEEREEMGYWLGITFSCLDVLCVAVFCDAFLERKTRGLRFVVGALLCGVLSYIATIFVSHISEESPITLLKFAALITVYFFFASLLYTGKFWLRLLVVVLAYAISTLLEFCVLYSLLALLHIRYDEYVANMKLYLASAAITYSLKFLLSSGIKKIHKPMVASSASIKWAPLTIGFPLISLVGISICYYLSMNGKIAAAFVLFSSGILLATNAVILILIDLTEKNNLAQVQQKTLNEQLRSQRANIDALSSAYATQRKMTHDFRHHIAALSGMLQGGETQQAQDYLAALQEQQTERALMVNTHNSAIDAVLNQKGYAAQKQHIDIQFEVNDLSPLQIELIDCTVVLGNLLDNAIEACLKLEEAKRRIEVSVLRDEAYADGDAKLYVSIINTSLPVHIEKDCIATTKLEPHLHGFGLPCAKELLRRNNAFYTMDYHDGAFQFCFEWPDVACNSCVHA